ncbi:uncharacterized protein UV8b_04687 [Ustilaginoidea virens]|uniref:rRNA methyltransferase 2, mitochondrial n=1 Tax=Ustilaginoidea virens TaxID=1159556 RepID=A0A8E5MHY4_USTVR|nr:uncharacterized protein UV8b_04687 [Ustilaginoidea virens]QUC20446.1 hypothetical protein UV8b_04687 [Ustilaginoidea virens]
MRPVAALSSTPWCGGRPSPRLAGLLLQPRCPVRQSSSSSRWKERQGRDSFAREAKVQGLKSRAAFKLLEMDSKYRLFKPGQTVVDLGYAPGSWSQVARERTRPHGLVIGIDLIPAQPPQGVATFQGDFLSPSVRQLVKEFIHRTQSQAPLKQDAADAADEEDPLSQPLDQPSYIDKERHASEAQSPEGHAAPAASSVDVVLSDMLMNTSGVAFRDHMGSMHLCTAALQFASDTLKPGGHFVCKFYQGADDKLLEGNLKRMFAKVFREKPDSSRRESKEAYLVALKRKRGVLLEPEDAP